MKKREMITAIFGECPSKYVISFEYLSGDKVQVNLDATNGMFQTYIHVEEDATYNASGDVLFESFELLKFDEFKKILVCEDCDNTGSYEVFQLCDKPASYCCGGCTRTEKCDHEDFYLKFLID